MSNPIPFYLILVFTAAVVVGEEKSSNGPDKKRGLIDEGYPGQQMVIKTHFAQEAQTYGKPRVDTRGYGYALLSAYPVAHIPLAKYPQRYFVIRKMPVESVPLGLAYSQESPYSYPQQQPPIYPQQQPPIYPQQQPPIYPQQQASIYPTIPYQVKLPYAGERYPYSYEQPYRYLLPKRYPLVSDDGLDYQRPPIDERSAYQISPTIQKPVVEEPPIYMPKQYYIQATTKEVYPEPKPIAYAFQVPDQQISVQKPIFLPVVDKNIQ